MYRMVLLISHSLDDDERASEWSVTLGIWLLMSEKEVAVIPQGISLVAAAPLACAEMTSWRALKCCDLKSGEWMGILGSDVRLHRTRHQARERNPSWHEGSTTSR